MKRWIPFVVSFLLALAVGCSNESEQPIDEHTPLSSESASEPAALDVSDLHDILTSVDLVAADLTFFHEGTEETFPAENAIRVESYIAALRKFTWESYQPPTEWDSTDDYC